MRLTEQKKASLGVVSQGVKVTNFDLRRLMAEIAIDVGSMVQARQFYGDISVSQDTPRHLSGDPAILKKIVLGLVNHSLSSLDVGGVTIRVAPGGHDVEGGCVLNITVTDTSIGMLPEELDEIFIPSRQHGDYVDQREKKSELFYVRELARLLDGNLSVHSAFGWGTRYSLSVAMHGAAMHVSNWD
ncbi:MAG: ATP-binding protein [Desulfobulbaceae bacterium]|nr:ATP-binding protein [Desulfobulbaceae bacterium]HIJ77884.1 HAMP domain-containing histidine kinase [Deltaproteobacteria bacterium]